MLAELRIQIDAMDFETAFLTLQESVSQLEQDDLPLAQSLELYECGQLLARHCVTLLETAELKVRQLAAANNLTMDQDA